MTIFIDTGIFVAYFNIRDEDHKKAVKIIADIESNIYGSSFTSDYVFDESITLTLMRAKRTDLALTLGDHILKSFPIIRIDSNLFFKSWTFFKKQKIAMSFTDLTSLAITEQLPIKRIATFDSDFKRFKHLEIIDG